jgi:hypothetical protein
MTMTMLYNLWSGFYLFGPGFGLPDPSPFVMKAEVLLKIAGSIARDSPRPLKASCPISMTTASGLPIPPSSRWHLEKRHKVDFDRGLSEEQRAVAWAFERTAEDHLLGALGRALDE